MVFGCIAFFITCLCFASGITAISGRRIGVTFLPGLVIAGLLSYVFTISGAFYLAKLLIPSLAGIVLILTVIFIKKPERQQRFLNAFRLEDVTVLFVFAILFLILSFDRSFSLNDEFSHWGLAIKNIFINNDIYASAASNDLYKQYPPFSTVLLAYCASLSGKFSESATFFAMDMLIAGALMPAFVLITDALRKSSKKIFSFAILPVIMIVLIVAVVSFKLSAFSIIAVDTLLGVLAFYMVAETLESKSLSLVPFGAVALTLTKEIGIALAVFSSIVCVFALLFSKKKPGNSVKKTIFSNLKTFICLCAIIPLSKISWSLMLSLCNVADRPSTANSLIRMLRNGLTPNQKTIVSNYFKAFFAPKISFGIPLIVVVAALLVISLGIIFFSKKHAKSCFPGNVVTLSFIFAGFIAYAIATLVSYLVNFSEYEGLQVASFERYFGTYLTFWTLILIYMVLEFVADKVNIVFGGKHSLNVVGALSIASILAIITLFFVIYPYPAAKSHTIENEYKQDVAVYKKAQDKLVPGNILYIDSEGDNRDRLVLNYIFAPCTVTVEKDIAKAVASGKYSYIYVKSASEADLEALKQICDDPKSNAFYFLSNSR